ncbi:hypothetical protein LPB41_23980 [Thalassospira sp. MA62]|nr:hypothetical protein [Thalassospira sp. MA62]
MLKLQNILLSFGILVSTIFIALFATNTLKWKTELGLPDVVNILVAILTFGAVYISYRASKSAERSASFSEEQTILLAKQFEYELSPALVPFGNEYTKESNFILNHHFHPKLKEHYSKYGTMTFSLKNVGKGAAYYLCTWIEVNNIDFCYENDVTYTNKDNENTPFSSYSITYNSDGAKKISISEFTTMRQANYSLTNDPQYHEIIESGQTLEILVPTLVQTLIFDSISRDFGVDKPKPTFTFYCIYKNIKQIETDELSKITYNFSLSEIIMDYREIDPAEFKLKTLFTPKIFPTD